MRNIDANIAAYLESKMDAWALSTARSESHRLNSVKELINGDAETLWKGIKARAPYTRVTIWVRVTDFYQWLIDSGSVQGANVYRTWKQAHAKQFKNAYQTELPSMSYAVALDRINSMKDPAACRRALEMIGSGTRWCESSQLTSDVVTGKGDKKRKVYRPEVSGPDFVQCYRTFLRALAAVGLKPHMLRKLCATEIARQGAHESDLCKLMGWESFATAKNYIAPMDDERLSKLVKRANGGLADGNTKE